MEKQKNSLRFFYFLLKITLIFSIVITLTLMIIGLIFGIYVEKKIDKTVDETLFSPSGMGETTKLHYYDTDDQGRTIEIEEILYSGYKCKSTTFEEIPKDLINAFISIEDRRFMEHSGVDFKRTIAAAVNYFLRFDGSFGGSTITQQLIKNVTEKDDYSLQRKIQEIFWALDLEKKLDKEEILHMYLSIINLSDGCFGVGAAAEYYFSKQVSELTLAECATIAAITNSPSYYNPIRNPENNKKRRDIILSEMLAQGYIDKAEYDIAINSDIDIRQTSAINNTKEINSWYTDMVIDDVVSALTEKFGYSRSMASLMIYTGGLNIYTAMDPDIQSVLEKYYADSSNFPSGSVENMLQSSTIVIDPKSGKILGVAGAVGAKKANRVQNFATQTLRPAGSVIKPLSVYAPALDAGLIDFASVYDDVPVNFGNYNLDPSKGQIIQPSAWPKNANGIYRGLTNINYAISHSINTVTVKVLEDLGIDSSFNFLYDKLKMKSLIPVKTLDNGNVVTDKDYAALALGQFNFGVTLRETAAAYSIFANNGIYNDCRSFTKVTDSQGKIILLNDYHGEAVISEDTASLMTLMLKNVLNEGTATDIKLKNEIEIAGKTGTTQNNNDKWFIGYTPSYICGTWLGYEYPKSLSDLEGNPCHDIWEDIMRELSREQIETRTNTNFNLSERIVKADYCIDSGKLLTEACVADPRGSRKETGYFVAGKEPHEYCDIHLLVDYDKETGAIASDGCPKINKTQVGLLNVKRRFPMQIYVSDAEYTWQNIGLNTLPSTIPELPFYSNLLGSHEYCGISYGGAQYNCYCREHFSYFAWKEEKET